MLINDFNWFSPDECRHNEYQYLIACDTAQAFKQNWNSCHKKPPVMVYCYGLLKNSSGNVYTTIDNNIESSEN